jgi:hypothetical protein
MSHYLRLNVYMQSAVLVIMQLVYVYEFDLFAFHMNIDSHTCA